MNVTTAQDRLIELNGYIDGKLGTIYSIQIVGTGEVMVSIDWDAFKSTFSGTSADRKGSIWTKTVGNVTFTSKQINSDIVTETVPV